MHSIGIGDRALPAGRPWARTQQVIRAYDAVAAVTDRFVVAREGTTLRYAVIGGRLPTEVSKVVRALAIARHLRRARLHTAQLTGKMADMTYAWRCVLSVAAALVAFPAVCGGPTQAPPEIAAAAPAGTHLLAFKSSGMQAGADAIAVYETAPDEQGVRHRDLIIFHNKGGKFVPEGRNDKIIGCSKCSQFHDDPFAADLLTVFPGYIVIEQMDSGEQPSSTTFAFAREGGSWRAMEASRLTFAGGRGQATAEKLPIPPSRALEDIDGRWDAPMFFNAIVVNDKARTFSFLHGDRTAAELDRHIAASCKDGADCRVLLRQQDGCMSLARDDKFRSFAAGVPDRKDKQAAKAQAIAACQAGGGKCEEVRTDCSAGAL